MSFEYVYALKSTEKVTKDHPRQSLVGRPVPKAQRLPSGKPTWQW